MGISSISGVHASTQGLPFSAMNSYNQGSGVGGPRNPSYHGNMRLQMRAPRPVIRGSMPNAMNNGPIIPGGHPMNRMRFIQPQAWNNSQGAYNPAARMPQQVNMDISNRLGMGGKPDEASVGQDMSGMGSHSYYTPHHPSSQSDHYRGDVRDHGDLRDDRDGRDIRDSRDKRDARDSRDSRDNRDGGRRLDDRPLRQDDRLMRQDDRSMRHDDRSSLRQDDRSLKQDDRSLRREDRSSRREESSSSRREEGSSKRGDDRSSRREEKSSSSRREKSNRSADRGRSRSREKSRDRSRERKERRDRRERY